MSNQPPLRKRTSPATLARNTLQSGLTRAEQSLIKGYEDLEKLIEDLESGRPDAALRVARTMRHDLGKTAQELRDQRARYPARPEREEVVPVRSGKPGSPPVPRTKLGRIESV